MYIVGLSRRATTSILLLLLVSPLIGYTDASSCNDTCAGYRITISGTMAYSTSGSFTFNLNVNGEQYVMTANRGFSLLNTWDCVPVTPFYELTAAASDRSYFRLRLPENVTSGNTYTDPKISDDFFSLYFWDGTNDENWYTYVSGSCGTISTTVTTWNPENDTAVLSFTSDPLPMSSCYNNVSYPIDVSISNFTYATRNLIFKLSFMNMDVAKSCDSNQTGGSISIVNNGGNVTFQSGRDMTIDEKYLVTVYQDINDNHTHDAGEPYSVIPNFIFDGSQPMSFSFDNWDSPIADAGNDQYLTGCDNNLTFDGSNSYAPYGTIISWEWLLEYQGDPSKNKTASGETASVTNLDAGIYNVTLAITDDVAKTGSDTMAVSVSEKVPWDINGDCRRGLEEIIFILRELTGQ